MRTRVKLKKCSCRQNPQILQSPKGRDLDNSEDAAAIVCAVAGLGASLGITTTAECVETEEQMSRVADEGYGEIQGFLFSPPRPANEVREFFPEIVKPAIKEAG